MSIITRSEYKKRQEDIPLTREQYKSKYQSKNNDSNSNITTSINFPAPEQNKINLPTMDLNSNSKDSVVWNKKESQTVQNLPIVKNANNIEKAQKQNLPILPMNTKDNYEDTRIKDAIEHLWKTPLSTANYLGQGILSTGEKFLDTALQIGSSKYNPFMHILYNGDVETAQKTAQELVQKNATQDLITNLSGDENFNQNFLDKNSLVKSDNLLGEVVTSIGTMLPSISLGNPKLATTSLAAQSYGSGIEEAYNEGASRGEATAYGLMSSAAEIASEWITGGIPGIKSSGGLDKLVAKGLGQKTLDELSGSLAKEILKAGYKIAGEGLEEALTEAIKPYIKNATYSENETINWEDVINSAIVGSITGGILEAPSNIYNIKSAYNNIKNTSKSTINSQGNMNIPIDDNYSNKTQTNENSNINLPPVTNYVYEETNNSKINNLRKSANTFLNNSIESKNLVNTIEKIINDKSYNIVFDNNIRNNKGDLVNAQISTLKNGEIEIKINPNSNRAGEFLLTHEITHAIETDSMKNLILDYASKNSEFNQALESLKQTYGTNDVSSEVVADISGQLFGNQEFINNLSTKQPNIFKRIYNKIIELANKITGNTKESLFIKDLKNKWETAYRNTTYDQAINNLGNETKYVQKNLNDGTNYIETEKNLFTKEDGTPMSQREIYNSLIGKQITFNDGITATIKQWLPNNKNMYNELFKRYPNYKNVKDIKGVNNNINENIVELLENSNNISSNEPDYMGRHRDNKIDSFDTRRVSFYDGTNAYDLDFSIAKMQDGNYIAYAKRNLFSNNTLLSKIKKEAPTSESRGVLPYVDNISQSNENVKSDILPKYSMQTNENNTQELNNSSFYFADAKQYDDLIKTNHIEYFRKNNGDVKVYLMDSNNNLLNEFSLWSNTNAIKELGENLGNKIYETATDTNQTIRIGNDINNLGTDTDYFMNHRPSEGYGNASNFEENMPGVFEHPEWYLNLDEKYNKESLNVLKKVRNSPDAELTIYRATIGNKINSGDWVTPSKSYAEYHNNSQFDGKGNILEMKVKAKDIQFAGDDINEFGYFPNNDAKYSQQNDKWQEHLENNYKATGTRTNLNDVSNKISFPLPTKEKNNLPDKEYYKHKINELKSIDYDSLSIDGKKLYDEELNRYESLIGNKTQEKINLPPVENKPAIEINSKKYDLNKLTIDQLVKDKNQALSNLDKKIEQKTNEYNLKKNKDTKIANNIKQRIEMLKNRKNNIEIDYNNKIQKLNSKNVKMLSDEQAIIEKNSNKITRKDVQESLLEQMGITVDDISQGKDINSIDSLRTDPIRLNEKVFGYEVGQKINDATINKTKYNESERTRFLNKERDEIRKLGIKARSKESAAVQKYAEKQYVSEKGDIYKYGDYELSQEFQNVKTQEKIKKAAQFLRNKYDTYIDQINEVITNMGYNPIPKRNDYMHHFNELNDKLSNWGVPLNMNSLKEDILPTDINGVTDQFKPGKNWFASAMHRTGPKTTYDAITGIDSYLEGASNLIYHTEDIQRYRTLIKYIRETYGQMHGLDNIDKMTPEQIRKRIDDVNNSKLSKYAAWLDEQANSLAGKKGAIDRATERALGRRIYSILDTAKKQVGSNMTGFNVRSALTNFASSVHGASKTNKIAFVKGTISTLQNIVHKDDLINKSTFLTNRFGSNSLSQKTWQKISNAGQILMTGSDYFTANQIWRSKYYENLQKGMSEDAAIKHADDFSSRIMGDRSKGSTAEIFNSKTLGLLTQFQLEVNNQWSSLIHDNKMDIQSGNKSGASVLFQLGQLAAASYLFNNMMKSLTGSSVMIDPIDMLMKIFNPDDDDDKSLEERSFEVIGDLVDNIPFGNIFTGGGRIPVSEAFTGTSTFTKKVTNQTDSYGNEITWKDVKDDMIGSAFYWILPTGYGQLRKTSKGLSMYDKELPLPGSYTNSGNLRFMADESIGGKIKAALFGQYSSEEAQKYIESGYKSINKNRINDMKELNMTSSEYRNYRESLKNASQTTDKNGYIKYEDDNKNTFWYDKNNKVVYDNNYNQVNKSITSLNKVSSKEKVFDYINSLNISDNEKSKLINAEYGGEKTDLYGNIKYVSNDYVYNINGLKKYKNGSGTTYWVNTKTGNVYNNNGKLATNVKTNTLTPVKEEKIYWYNETDNILYDSKYNKVDIKKLESLTKVETKIDMSEYGKYDSYEEYNYATSNPKKYSVINQITTYDKYNAYKEKIDSIKEQSINKKTDVIKYVNSLNLSIPQKAMLIKTQYSSYDKYDKQIIQYINSKKLSINEKTKILQELGFTVRNGKVIS